VSAIQPANQGLSVAIYSHIQGYRMIMLVCLCVPCYVILNQAAIFCDTVEVVTRDVARCTLDGIDIRLGGTSAQRLRYRSFMWTALI